MLEALNEFVFALARHDMGKTTVTIEMTRGKAEELCWRIQKDITATLLASHYEVPIISLGSVFRYRGVNFRIVEIAE